MTRFELTWVSTDAQLAALAAAYSNANLLTKLTGDYRVDPDTAHIRGILTPWMRVPLVYVAQGELTVDSQLCEFTPRPRPPMGWRLFSGEPGLRFRLRPGDVLSVEPADFRSPVAGIFDLPFTRLRTRSAEAGDLLLCAGGRIHVPRVRARSLELRRALEAFAASTGPSAGTV